MVTVFQEAHEPGIDLEHPPNMKIFDATYRDPSDVAELSQRRLAALKTRDTNAPAPVNVSFDGLADVFKHILPQSPTMPTSPILQKHVSPPRLSLPDFCERFHLSASVQAKLAALDITGPHGLHWINDEGLRNEGRRCSRNFFVHAFHCL
jgi:hypothetical protein